MTNRVDPIRADVAIVDEHGNPTPGFVRQWQNLIHVGTDLEQHRQTINSAKLFLQRMERLLDRYAELAVSAIYSDQVTLQGAAGVQASIDTERVLRVSNDSALASLITTVTATANDATATALMRAIAVAGPAGVAARIALQVRAAVGGSYEAASIFLDALSGGGSQISLSASTIFLDGVVLSSGALQTSALASEAATIHKVATGAGPRTPAAGEVNTWITLLTLPTFTSTGKPIEISGQFMLHNTDAGSPGTHHHGVRVQRNGSTVWPAVAPTFGTNGSSYNNYPIDWVETPGAGSVVYTLDYFPDSVSCDAVNYVLSADEIKV